VEEAGFSTTEAASYLQLRVNWWPQSTPARLKVWIDGNAVPGADGIYTGGVQIFAIPASDFSPTDRKMVAVGVRFLSSPWKYQLFSRITQGPNAGVTELAKGFDPDPSNPNDDAFVKKGYIPAPPGSWQ